MISHRVWAEVDLGALRRNLEVIRSLAGPTTDTLLVVKADAYGHGLRLVATTAERFGVGAFGVRDSSEALELRGIGVRKPILVLGTVIESELTECVESGIEIGIHTLDRIRSLRKLVRRLGSRLRAPARVHLNVDTGMGRLGPLVQDAPRLLEAILAAPELQLAGIMTHLARPEGFAHPFSAEQVARL
ncbi:MAG TPA: alanine racemase, partial [Planctomycetota bacterium]|nr:alanine racemase [Planctomycetota bacterium]